MISPLNSKLLRDIKQSWLLLGAIAAIMSVGIGSFIAMMSAYRNLEQTMFHYYGTSRLADFWVDLKKAPEQEVYRLATMRGLSEIRTRIQFRVTLDLAKTEKPVGALLLSLPDAKKPVINNIILRTGTYFTEGRRGEVIVSEKFAEARGIKPGDVLTAILGSQKRELYVVGTAISAEFVYMTSPGSMIDQPGSYGLMWIKRSFAEDIFGFQNSCNAVVGLFAPEIKHNKQLLKALESKLESFGVYIAVTRSDQFSTMVLEGEMKQLRAMAITMPSFFLVVAALVLHILMLRIAEQQRTVAGTFKALGYSNSSLSIHYLQFALVPGLAGGVGGALFGYFLGLLMTEQYLHFFSFPHFNNVFYPDLVFIGMAISLIFSVFGTLVGVRKIAKLTPAEAMRPRPPKVGGSVILERIKVVWKLFDSQFQMIVREILRNKVRSCVSVFAAAIGSSIVLLTFGFVDSLDEMIVTQFGKMLKSDYHITFDRERSLDTLYEIRRIPAVALAEPVYHLPCTFIVGSREVRGTITAVPRQAKLTEILQSSGKVARLPGTGLAMAGRVLSKLHIQPGQNVTIVPAQGNRIPFEAAVISEVDSMVGLAIYCSFDWLHEVMGQEPVINEVRIQLLSKNGAKISFLEKIKTLPGVENITDIQQQKDALVVQQNGLMRYAAFGLIVFAGIIFLGTVITTSLVAISEKIRDIATFRTLGYSESQVARLFFKENILINLTGTLIGLPLGHMMLFSMMESFATDAYSFPAAIHGVSYLYSIGLTFIFVFLAQIVVRRKVSKVNWVEALSVKE